MTFSTPEAEKVFNTYKMIYSGKDLDVSKIRINWEMTKWCNYRCPYCIQGQVHDCERESQEYLETIAHKLRDKLTGKNIALTIMGGEISYFDLISISNILFKDNNCSGKYNLITNLSNSIKVYTDFCSQSLGNIRPVVQPSYQWINIDTFLEKAKELKRYDKNEVFSCTCVVDDTKTIEMVKEVQAKFDKANIPIRWTLGRVPRTKHTKFYDFQDGIKEYVLEKNEETKAQLKEGKTALTFEYMNGEKKGFLNKADGLNEVSTLLKSNGARFENYICKTGVAIRPNGDVMAGLCPERITIKLGNILEDDVKIGIYSNRCSGKSACNGCNNILIWNGKF